MTTDFGSNPNGKPRSLPRIIQGGMGIAISDWRLAQAVSRTGQMGVVSGTALDVVMARRLQDGDPGRHLERALADFPVPEVAQRVWREYFLPAGERRERAYKAVPQFTLQPRQDLLELAVVANFAEVYLAKEGHDGLVGINYLEKIQMPFLPSLYGALLAGVDCVLIGAGIPREVPGFLDSLTRHEDVSCRISVEGAPADEEHRIRFSPAGVLGKRLGQLPRPVFLAIISSSTLAHSLARRSAAPPDGFVVEGFSAGGHNAPPRGPLRLSERGEPVYGPRDEIDIREIRALGLPFWLAGSLASPEGLAGALSLGASGIQVGTAFAYCRESGFSQVLKSRARTRILAGAAQVRTDARASPTGFPFKLLELEGTLGEAAVYETRPRVPCDVALLRKPFKRSDGTVGYRCPAEPQANYEEKGGAPADTEGCVCLCNALLAAAGFAQERKGGYREPAAVTSGADLSCIAALSEEAPDYGAADVIRYLLGAPLLAAGSRPFERPPPAAT